MATYMRQKPASWFTILAVVLVLWGLMGVASVYMHVTYRPELDPSATDWDRAFFNALPAWLPIVAGVATGTGLLGAIALLFRSKLARPLFIVSLAAVFVQFGYIFLGTDLLAHKSMVETVPLPLCIALIGAFEIWLSGYAQRRGWIS